MSLLLRTDFVFKNNSKSSLKNTKQHIIMVTNKDFVLIRMQLSIIIFKVLTLSEEKLINFSQENKGQIGTEKFLGMKKVVWIKNFGQCALYF